MPPEVTLEFVIPPELGDADEVRQILRERVAFVEEDLAATRARTGVPILGRRAILRQPWWAQPSSHEPRRGLRPRVAARSFWPRLEALLRNRDFVSRYGEARAHWLAGLAAVFPSGTYWLRRFANVPITQPIAN
ncbi:MAG: hypothetical protein K8W52_28490 [Deltaproteobacteria bacterium]|nr:hypothetical protein [Deltaproteobacteria bacterium]